MLSPPPATALELAGLDPPRPSRASAGVQMVAAAREPALHLAFDGGALLRGVSPHVARSWAVPDLSIASEERPDGDPAADLPPPLDPGALASEEIAAIAASPDGAAVAVHTREGRQDVVAILRADDRALIRWIRGARAAAWSPDATLLAVGGPGASSSRGRPRLAGRPGSTGRRSGGPVPSGGCGPPGARRASPPCDPPGARRARHGAPGAGGARARGGGDGRRHPGPHPRAAALRRGRAPGPPTFAPRSPGCWPTRRRGDRPAPRHRRDLPAHQHQPDVVA